VKVSDSGIQLVHEFEGFSARAYPDVGGKATIGIGHLIRKGEVFDKLTEAEAVALLCKDLEFAEACIEDSVDVPLTQNQYDALASFVFNLGCAAFKGSTLLKRINAGDPKASDEFRKWCKVGQNQVTGLLRRRIAEQLLFDKPDTGHGDEL
jgi:lysozyme